MLLFGREMAVLLTDVPADWAAQALPHKTWTRRELAVVESIGLLEGERFELLDGELIHKMGKKRPHVVATMETARALREVFGEDFVNTEAPINVAEPDNAANEPEPDVVVLRQPSRSLPGNPGPGELALVVEVADSTLRLDLTAKARLYARAGIREYWVVDLAHRVLHVMRDPAPDGYRSHAEWEEAASVDPLDRPGSRIPVQRLMP